MGWNTIATADVLAEFTAAEQATLNNIQGANTQLGTVLTKVIARVRSAINAGGNQVDQTSTTTTPDALNGAVIDIARWRWLNSFPALKAMQTPERKAAHDAGEARLRDISSQKPDRERTELPATVDTTPVPIIQPSMGHSKPIEFSPRNQDG